MVDVAGPVGAKRILLVHGSVVTRAMWQPQIERLADEYRLIAPDLPGHGALTATRFRLDTAIETVSRALDQETPGRALIVGSSLGGHVATAFAHRYPEQVAGLVISGSSMNFDGVVGLWVKVAGLLMLKLFSEKRLTDQSAKSLRKKLPASVAEPVITTGLYPRGAAESFLELPGHDFRAMLSAIRVPILILNGENDRPNRRSEAAFAASAPNARIQTIPGAGHACSMEQPETFTAAVREFAESLDW